MFISRVAKLVWSGNATLVFQRDWRVIRELWVGTYEETVLGYEGDLGVNFRKLKLNCSKSVSFQISFQSI